MRWFGWIYLLKFVSHAIVGLTSSNFFFQGGTPKDFKSCISVFLFHTHISMWGRIHKTSRYFWMHQNPIFGSIFYSCEFVLWMCLPRLDTFEFIAKSGNHSRPFLFKGLATIFYSQRCRLAERGSVKIGLYVHG